jgi:hypothetical protein
VSSTQARHEHLLELEAGGKGWKKRRAVDYLKMSPAGMELHHDGMLREPLILPLGAIAVAAAEPGAARALPNEGRFPILRRIAGTKVVPREEGVEGWLWTTAGGSAFLSLCEDDVAPNVALVFAHPLGEDIVTHTFEPACVATVAARSPLGSPVVYGLLMRVPDVLHAQNTFRKFHIANPLTDREVAPTLRRALPTDVSADPTVRFTERAWASQSVAPPGLA